MLWLGAGGGALGFAEWLLAASSQWRVTKAVDCQERLLDGLCCPPLLSCLRHVLATRKLPERKGKARKCPPFPTLSDQKLGNESCPAEQGGLQIPGFPSR